MKKNRLYKNHVIKIIISVSLVFIGAVCLSAMFQNEHMLTRLVYAQSIAGPNIIDHRCTDLSKIPQQWIRIAKANLHIGYNHASHGRQPIEGMKNLDAFMGDTGLYAVSVDGIDRGPDVLDIADGYDHPGVWWYEDVQFADRLTDSDDWVELTRAFLDDPGQADINVMIWSWCNITHYPDGTSQPAVAYDVERYYIPYMETLIREYGPGGSKIRSGERATPVIFVFMTGHSNFGTDGRNIETFQANKKIRQHCIEHNRVLYDFYDIECYDPDGTYFGDGESNAIDYGNYQAGCGHGIHNLNADTTYATDPCSIWANRGNWGVEWQNRHVEGIDYFDCFCAHCTEAPVLANLKAYAMWWLMARLAGWNENNSISTTTITIPNVTSSTTTSSSSRPCLAEVMYGNDSKEIYQLRYVRDSVFNKTREGQEIINLYYLWSPLIVKAMEHDEEFREEMRIMADSIINLIEEVAE